MYPASSLGGCFGQGDHSTLWKSHVRVSGRPGPVFSTQGRHGRRSAWQQGVCYGPRDRVQGEPWIATRAARRLRPMALAVRWLLRSGDRVMLGTWPSWVSGSASSQGGCCGPSGRVRVEYVGRYLCSRVTASRHWRLGSCCGLSGRVRVSTWAVTCAVR